MRLEAVFAAIDQVPLTGKRRIIGLCGAPASGKSTLSEALTERLPNSAVVPMDGFHLDNRILSARGLLPRKGAPETFDVAGFAHLVRRLRHEDEVIYPLFDRSLDCAVAGAGRVGADTTTLIVEGNYLLYDGPGWRDLAGLWDVSIYLSVPQDVLRTRLMRRWRDHGFSEGDARAKVEGNDLPNAQVVADHLIVPDHTVTPEDLA